eukprot:CAMPEP_0175954486 /NCGR_PEP_ID=MMETSP0108-20121206/31948_1 /TAXON_ID=195067 ORGANISM="Goniomonas pacifica, Strain CCMP1869" /NCGR_SAMPLE_ID=MMETSP0108 /ASSEMBLY_ACC=CAM_ASM_000204 /LENGTH=42 /DNA_ID= /DNA_START= /DNA_END= /DNA_ORIENTATION=
MRAAIRLMQHNVSLNFDRSLADAGVEVLSGLCARRVVSGHGG